MKQQINLLEPRQRRPRVPFSTRAMAVGGAVFLAGLLAVHAYASWQVERLEHALAALRLEGNATRRQLAGLARRVPERHASQLLAAEVARLTSRIARERSITDALERGGLGNTHGFSAFLEGLARQRIEGLWLERVHIIDGGRALELAGRALEPKLVPVLVQRLSGEAAFAGARFGMLRITRDHDGQVKFVLRTAPSKESHS